MASRPTYRISPGKVLLAAALCVSFAAHTLAAEPPHIVVYLSDDHSQADSSLYGATDIPTPQFERLAADGMMFTHAFVASPSCAPSRSAMLTGLMPARNGAEANHTTPRDDVRSLVLDLKQAGYEVVSCGKVAHAKAQPFGFDRVFEAKNYVGLKRQVSELLESRDPDRPLCLFAGISNPHVPWPSQGRFAPDQIRVPPTHLDLPATRKYRALYYEEIAELDTLLGELRDLSHQHLGDNVVFVHTSDHGAQWPFGKWTLYDYGIRVPLLVSWPGVIEPGSRADAMVQWTDLLPTLLDLAGAQVPENLDGKSFAQVLRGTTAEHRDRIFTTHTGDGDKNIYPIRSVRNREWKLIHNLHPEFAFTTHIDLVRSPGCCAYWADWAAAAASDPAAAKVVDRYYRRPEWELYHLTDDPTEQQNLADDPEYAELLEKLKNDLAQWQHTQGDTALVHREPRLLSDRHQWHPDYTAESQAGTDRRSGSRPRRVSK